MDIQITVADIIYPAPGKKQGKIIDHTGKEWQVWGDKMSGYHRGNNYVVQKYKTSDFKGKTYYTIEEISPLGPVGAEVPRRPTLTEPVKLVAASPISENERRMDIFVCGAFNNMMANPNINPAMLTTAAMIEMVKQFKAVWVNTLGPNRPGTAARAAQNADINDELPEGF